ncbi:MULTISPECIES: hypothetical protein [Gluconobacter]|uniref:hypothetical protein n=1 Tax=Gluconobacter TaxID=441 RepID=UPI000A3BC28D|nr:MULTISPECIES: hypothetical protein [Gluconobacter]MBS1021903.1 hypothetical protein [Gluconobacter cerinus]OUJ04961.1 hypothetical protein HK24_13300 [Gluconobacter sp. DsW_058]
MEISRFNLSPKSHAQMVTNEQCIETVSGALQARYGELRNAAKRVSRARGWTVKAFTNWLYGKNAPRMHDLIVLMADDPDLESRIKEMVQETRECLHLQQYRQ